MNSKTAQILLVEDDPTLAEITAFRLELLGYSVENAYSADEALCKTADGLPEVIVLDLGLNGGEGYELLNQLSNEQYTANIPVMVFSTSADLDDVQKAYTSGAKEYLVTPFDPALFEQKIEKLLSASAVAMRADSPSSTQRVGNR